MVARLVRDQEVVGSSPVTSTKKTKGFYLSFFFNFSAHFPETTDHNEFYCRPCIKSFCKPKQAAPLCFYTRTAFPSLFPFRENASLLLQKFTSFQFDNKQRGQKTMSFVLFVYYSLIPCLDFIILICISFSLHTLFQKFALYPLKISTFPARYFFANQH